MRKKIILISALFVSLVFLLGVSGAVKPLYYKIYPVVNIIVNGTEINVAEGDVPAFQIDGRTMVPIRMVAEALNADVEWDEQTRSVKITKEEIEPIEVQPEVSTDLIKVDNVSFNTTRTKIIGTIANNNTEYVDVKVTINCYGGNQSYLGHVHATAISLKPGEIWPFEVEASEDLKFTNTFIVKVDSVELN